MNNFEIDHLGIAVRSIDGALRFYRDTLGMAVASREKVEHEGVEVAMLPAAGSRLELLADTNFQPTLAIDRNSPCVTCQSKDCISNCPAGALDEANFSLPKCLAYRKLPDAKCHFTCLARVSCPVGSEHRYSAEQLHHTYSISLRYIRQNLAM